MINLAEKLRLSSPDLDLFCPCHAQRHLPRRQSDEIWQMEPERRILQVVQHQARHDRLVEAPGPEPSLLALHALLRVVLDPCGLLDEF